MRNAVTPGQHEITDVDQNHHASHNPEQGWDKSELNKLMARWSNAGPYQRSRESSGDTVCQFAAALSSLLHKNFARGDTSDLPRLSDAKVLR